MDAPGKNPPRKVFIPALKSGLFNFTEVAAWKRSMISSFGFKKTSPKQPCNSGLILLRLLQLFRQSYLKTFPSDFSAGLLLRCKRLSPAYLFSYFLSSPGSLFLTGRLYQNKAGIAPGPVSQPSRAASLFISSMLPTLPHYASFVNYEPQGVL